MIARGLVLGLGLALASTLAAAPRVQTFLDTAACPATLAPGKRLLTEGIGATLLTLRVQQVVARAHATLGQLGDLVLTASPALGGGSRVCVGVYDDGGKPNAVAIGTQTVLFGASLLPVLQQRKAVNTLFDLVMLHELSHVLQNVHKEDYRIGMGAQTLELATTKRKELVADCVAGTLYSLQVPPLLSMEQNEAIRDIWDLLGDKHAIGDHGRACQRRMAWGHGFTRANVPDPRAPLAFTSGSLLRGCRQYVDRPDVLFSQCQ